jgi:iron(III) transport system substrate-binding protein
MAAFRPNHRSLPRFGFKLMAAVLYLLTAGCLLQTGCIGRAGEEVVVYAALDREFSQPILQDIQQELGMRVLAKYDQESNKTVGLVNDLIQNSQRPRCDVFRNNEIMHTLRLQRLQRLQRLGMLDVYLSPLASGFPDQFVSAEKTWHGFAARARVLIVNTQLIPDPGDYPQSI